MGYLVRPTSKSFRVLEETWTPERKVVTVPKTAYKALGFSPDMTVDEAKARAKQLNAQNDLDNKRFANTARRVELMQTEKSAYLPARDVARFEAELAEMYGDNPYRHDVTLRYWRAAQLVILELAVDVKDFRANNHKFINYFKRKMWSHDYIKRITRILNMWGACVSRHRGAHFDPLPKLSSVQVQTINDKREDAEGVRMPAEPLPWVRIKNAQDKFESEGLLLQWNWLKIAAWFGLRPLEVDNLKRSKNMRVRRDPELGVDVLEVMQTKLVNLPKDDRWKPIPVYFKEQKEALELIYSGEFKRPLNKTLQRLFGDGIETYSPRKAFADLMLERGFDLEDVATFMGHRSIEMTWRHYKNHRKFKLPKVG